MRRALTAAPPEPLTPEEEELASKRAQLAALEADLADRELDLAAVLADLNHFEKRYLKTVGRRYALLDQLKADLAEARARQHPDSPDAREQARHARAKARESTQAAREGDGEQATSADAAPSKPQRSESLNKLYRQAARFLHPDLTLDGDEKNRCHRAMSELNDAYACGDEEKIRAILRDWHASPENVPGDGPGAELVRVIRKIAQAQKRLTAIAAELERLRKGELFELQQQVEKAHAGGRDLLNDLGQRLDREIARAREELHLARGQSTP
jgi:hypothetical protein